MTAGEKSEKLRGGAKERKEKKEGKKTGKKTRKKTKKKGRRGKQGRKRKSKMAVGENIKQWPLFKVF